MIFTGWLVNFVLAITKAELKLARSYERLSKYEENFGNLKKLRCCLKSDGCAGIMPCLLILLKTSLSKVLANAQIDLCN